MIIKKPVIFLRFEYLENKGKKSVEIIVKFNIKNKIFHILW